VKNSTIIATSLGGVAAFAVGLAIIVTSQQSALQSATIQPAPATSQSASVPTEEVTTSSDQQIDELLTYLIEEEKLAHDVYVALGEMWGTQIFSNISESESQHQSQVETLLVSYGITDPRSVEPGVFVNDELQSLYDSLIEMGSQSASGAIEAGILIEETDIRDLQVAIDQIDNADVDAVLTSLLKASENHLAAFSRQR
jgi:hypothetical protein